MFLIAARLYLNGFSWVFNDPQLGPCEPTLPQMDIADGSLKISALCACACVFTLFGTADGKGGANAGGGATVVEEGGGGGGGEGKDELGEQLTPVNP